MISYKDELYHHGSKGQKWGVRRYQNPDGTLTAKGQKRYNKISNKYEIRSFRARDSLAKNKKLAGEYKRDLDELNRDKLNSKLFKKDFDEYNGESGAHKTASKKELQAHFDWLLDSTLEGYEITQEDIKDAEATIKKLDGLKQDELRKYGLAGRQYFGG